ATKTSQPISTSPTRRVIRRSYTNEDLSTPRYRRRATKPQPVSSDETFAHKLQAKENQINKDWELARKLQTEELREFSKKIDPEIERLRKQYPEEYKAAQERERQR